MKKYLVVSMLVLGLAAIGGVAYAQAFGGFGKFMGNPEKAQQMLNDKASILGISADDLKSELQSGKSFLDIAKEQGVSVDVLKTKLHEQQITQTQDRLSQMVTDGWITQEQMDNRMQLMQDNYDKYGFGGMGWMHGMGRGMHD